MPDKDDVLKVAEGTDKFLENSINQHRRRLSEAISDLERKIMDMAAEFQVSDGTLMGPRVNMKLAQKMHSDLTKIFEETYGKASREVIQGFNESLKYIKKEFKELDVVMDYTSVDKDMVKTLKTNALNNFKQFGDAAREQVADVMYSSVVGGSSFSNMVAAFSGILSGHLDKRGRPMSAYAELYAHDAIMDFHNMVNLKKAKDLGFDYFLYYGNLMNTSRDFCIDRVMKVYSREEIESWDFGWKGKSGPAMTNRGGYNCRHHWRPVKKSWVGKEVAEEDVTITPVPEQIPESKIPLAKKFEDIDKIVVEKGIANQVVYSGGGQKLGGRISKKRAVEKFNKVITEITAFQIRSEIALPKVNKFYITGSRRGAANVTLPAIDANISFAEEWSPQVVAGTVKWEEMTGKIWRPFISKESHTAYNVRHEYAHVIDGELGKRRGVKSFTDTEFFTETQKSIFKDDKFPSSKISNYAGKNRREWFAEAFATYTSPYYEKGMFPKRLEAFLEVVLDEFRTK